MVGGVSGCSTSALAAARALLSRQGKQVRPKLALDQHQQVGPPVGEEPGQGARRVDRSILMDGVGGQALGHRRDGEDRAHAGVRALVGDLAGRGERVHEDRAPLHPREPSGIDQMPRLRQQRHVQADRIGLFHAVTCTQGQV